jgi:U6 snRNA-associated Sm-like protein LSm3
VKVVGKYASKTSQTTCKGKSKKNHNLPVRDMTSIDEPLDLIKLSIGEKIYVKCRGDREIRGILQAFDQHLNMILSQAEETVTVQELDPETYEEIIKQSKRQIEMLFVRGDIVILVAPPLRTA